MCKADLALVALLIAIVWPPLVALVIELLRLATRADP